MASEAKKVQDIQRNILQKIGDKTVAEHLEVLEAKGALYPQATLFYSSKAIIDFRNGLIGLPIPVLDSLYSNKAFTAWLQKAVGLLLPISSNTAIFNPAFQKEIQPLIDLLYYFNQVDFSIETLLCRFEAIKLLTEKSEENHMAIYTDYFKERINDAIFCASDETISTVINTAFSNCRADRRPGFKLASQLEQACFVAWLIPHIKQQPNFKLLNESRYQELNGYLENLHDQYFSVKTTLQTYSFNSPANSSLVDVLTTVKKRVAERLEYLNARDPSGLEKEIKLKDSFLQLFHPDPILSFFFSSRSQFNIVNTIRETEETQIDWSYVLQELLAEMDAFSLPVSEIEVLSQHINFFLKTLEQTSSLKIPALSDLGLATEAKPCAPKLSSL